MAPIKQTIHQEEMLMLFSNIVGARDEYTQGHSHHVAVVAEAIAECIPQKLDMQKLGHAALLHDIGKVCVPDHILNKDGKLDDDEWAAMRRHPIRGKQLLQGSPFEELGDIILYHHERMDGRGYYGLQASDIPLESRIIAVADTFSALRTWRIYRPAMEIEDTVTILREAAGTQLDADIVEAFLRLDYGTLHDLECNCDICRRRRESQSLAASKPKTRDTAIAM